MPNFADYIDKGLGVASFVALIGLLIYYISQIQPMLKKQELSSATNDSIIQNNTDAVKEVARSNENVATALQMLQTTIELSNKIAEKHDERTCNIETIVVKLDERTKSRVSQG